MKAAVAVVALAWPALAMGQTATNWLGGTGNWNDGTKWSNGVPNGNTFDARIDNGNASNSAVTINGSFTVGSLEIDSDDSASLSNALTFTLAAGGFTGAGVLTNNGNFTLNSAGNNTDFIISGAGSILGSGTFTLGSANARVYAPNGTDRLTIGSGQTMDGIGQIGVGDLALTNNGTINADNSAGSLVLQPNTGTGEDFTNNAMMEASAGGTLLFQSGSFINTSGTIQALTGSTVKLVAPTITGGILTTAGTGAIHNTNSAVLTSVTNKGVLLVDNATALSLSTGLTNNGTLTVNGGVNSTDLRINNALTIDGTGTITLVNANSRIYATNGADRLTLGANQTINGIGQLGFGDMALTNNGLVDANNSSGSLLLQPNGGTGEDFTNNAIMQASAGGTLVLESASFINTNGTIQALNGSLVNLVTPIITGGTLTTAGTGEIHSINHPTLTSVTNAGNFIADGATTTDLSTGLTNNGTITLVAPSNTTDLRILNPLTIGGSGTISLTSSTARIYAANGTDRLTIGANQTIDGLGQIGVANAAVTNNGLIDANSGSGSILLQPNGATGEDFTNNATMQASAGGTLQLQSGAFTNTNGIIQALNGSTVNLNTPSITGGVLTTAGTGTIHNIAGSTLTSVTNNGTLIIDNATVTSLSTGLTNNGVITINSGVNNTDLRLSNPLTIGGSGTITLGNGNARVYSTNGTDRLTIGSGQTVNGVGQLGLGNMALTNNGLIDANNSAGSLILQPSSSTNEDFTNAASGTWQASNGSTMTLQSGKFTNNGTVQALDGSTVTFNASNATLTNNSAGTLTGGTYKAISTANAATVNLSGGNVTNNAAAVYLSGALASIPQINTISQIQSPGEFHILGGKTFTTAGPLTNAGTLEVGPSSNLTVVGNYVQTSGLSIVNGLLNATGGNVILNGGTLMGDGSVNGFVNNSLGTVSPGNSPGELTVSAYVSSSSGVLDIELAGATPGTGYDVLHDTGGATIAGTLNVSLLSFTPSFGQTFTILDATSLSGTFTTVNLPPDLTLSYTPTSVILTGVPEPASLGLIAAGSLLALRRRRRP